MLVIDAIAIYIRRCFFSIQVNAIFLISRKLSWISRHFLFVLALLLPIILDVIGSAIFFFLHKIVIQVSAADSKPRKRSNNALCCQLHLHVMVSAMHISYIRRNKPRQKETAKHGIKNYVGLLKVIAVVVSSPGTVSCMSSSIFACCLLIFHTCRVNKLKCTALLLSSNRLITKFDQQMLL